MRTKQILEFILEKEWSAETETLKDDTLRSAITEKEPVRNQDDNLTVLPTLLEAYQKQFSLQAGALENCGGFGAFRTELVGTGYHKLDHVLNKQDRSEKNVYLAIAEKKKTIQQWGRW